MAPLRRRYGGAIAPTIKWILYADDQVDPLRRRWGGANTPTMKWLLYADDSQLDWSIGSMAFSADQGAGTATFQTITTAFYVDNFEVDFATFSLNLPLNAGDYWLTLKNGLSDAGSDISWDVSGGPAIAQFQHSGVIDATDSEYFRLSGNDAAGTPPPPAPVPVPVPEPTSLLLLGVGLIGCAAVRRRCTGTTA